MQSQRRLSHPREAKVCGVCYVYSTTSPPLPSPHLTPPPSTPDLQIVNIGLRVLYKPDPFELTAIYRTLGIDFDERVLPSITNEVWTVTGNKKSSFDCDHGNITPHSFYVALGQVHTHVWTYLCVRPAASPPLPSPRC